MIDETLLEALEIHSDEIRRYGGATGLRDLRVLQSAIAMPGANHGGRIHTEACSRWRPPVDSTSRGIARSSLNELTASMCALALLALNGKRLAAAPNALFAIVDGMASDTVDKAEIAVLLRDHCAPR